jgi:hypothetical protein
MGDAFLVTLATMDDDDEFVNSDDSQSVGEPWSQRKKKPRPGGGGRKSDPDEPLYPIPGLDSPPRYPSGRYASRRAWESYWHDLGYEFRDLSALYAFTPTFYFAGGTPFTALKILQAVQGVVAHLQPWGDPDRDDFALPGMLSPFPAIAGGFRIAQVDEGSVFTRLAQTIGKALSKEIAREVTDQVRQGLEANFIDKPQSEAALNMADAILKLAQASDGVDNAAFDLGPVKFAKVTDADGNATITAKAFGSREAAQLTVENREALVRDPESFVRALGLESGAEPENEPEKG